MSVLASLYSGISGIVSNGSALSVSGDNIANMNTMAFKSGNALFESNLTQRIGDVEVGLGSRLAATNSSFTQGAFSSSTRSTDLAIQGEGFFGVQSAEGTRFYTRAGSFTKDPLGNLVTTVGGYQLLGYRIENGSEGTIEEVINFENVSSVPEASSFISMSINLDPDAEVIGGAFDGTTIANAEASSNFSVPSIMYDSLGRAQQVVTFFRRTDANEWEYYTMTDLANLDDTMASGTGTAVIMAGDVEFDTDGTILMSTITNDGNGLTQASATISAGEILNATTGIPWAGADAVALFNPGVITDGTFTRDTDNPEFIVDFGHLTGSSAVVTQYDTGGGSSVSGTGTDGIGVGQLQSIDILKDGVVRGIFSNGQSQDLFRIPLVKFANQEGLSRVGANLFQATSNSGDPLFGRASQGGLGEIRSFSLEQSNVDLASEFVKIIQFQRAFQASSRTISAAADLLQDLVNLAR